MEGKGESPARVAVLVAALATLATLLFIPALKLPLFADDYVFISHGKVPGWWHSHATWNFGTDLFRPIPRIWIGAFNHMFGLHPVPFHIASLALLVGAGVVLALIARRLGLGIGAYAAAAVFCLHASMATPVGWAAAVNSPLASLLSLSAVFVLLRRRIRPVDVVVACVLFAMALMTREVVAVTPGILLLTRFMVETGQEWRPRIRRTIVASLPLWAVLIFYAVIRRLAGFSSSSGAYAQKLSTHGFTNLGRLMQYATDFDRFASPHGYDTFVDVFWVGLIGLCVLAAWRWHRPLGLIGLAWAGLGVLPVIFLATHAMSYYYVDFGLPGLAITAATLFQLAVDLLPDRAEVPVGVACLAALLVVSANTTQKELDKSTRAETRQSQIIINRLKRQYPNPPKGSTIVVHGTSYDYYLLGNGTALRVIYNDPTLKVVFVPS